jgi:hypothetical protein
VGGPDIGGGITLIGNKVTGVLLDLANGFRGETETFWPYYTGQDEIVRQWCHRGIHGLDLWTG